MLKTEELFDLSKTIAADLFADKAYPWELLDKLSDFIKELGESLPEDEYERRGEDVWIARDAVVFPSAFIMGPCIIDHGAQVRHCAFIRGSAVIGKNSVVGNSVELKNVILFDGVQVPHYNYVGDSILGFKAHMGAGAVTSNVKADRSNVIIKAPGLSIPSNRKKVGAFLGDMAEIGCNSVLNPGTVIGRRSSVYPCSSVRGYVPEDCIYKAQNQIVKRK